MKEKLCKLWPWGLPLVLVLLGIPLYNRLPTNFLGLICFCLAVLVCCYLGARLLRRKKPFWGKIVMRVLDACVALGLIVVIITGSFVAAAAAGEVWEPCDYIVVLGAKVNGTEPSKILASRIDAAYEYLLQNPAAVAVLSGGQGPDEGISEARCMFNELTKMGIAPARLLLEDKSTSTWENLHFSLNLIAEKSGTWPERIGLVTSEFHLFRAGNFARACGVDAVGIPGGTANKVHFVNYFLREIAGVWHYIILGG